MKLYENLPAGYEEYFIIDLKKNKKQALTVNVLAIIISIALIVPVHFLKTSLLTLFDFSQGMTVYFLRFLGLIGFSVLYIILHELTHGLVMKLYGTPKVKYGFTGMYAFAGSDCYYAKTPYLVIALAPVILWGIILAVICPFLQGGWFWVVYLIQVTNLSGAAGDIYVTLKLLREPENILIKDHGVSMSVFKK